MMAIQVMQYWQMAAFFSAVKNFPFDMQDGEILVIIGLSVSGKSTMICCITRLNEQTSGKMLFDGKDLLKTTEHELIDVRRH
jgi:glycine betaine/proline transport system ATP-binding protein